MVHDTALSKFTINIYIVNDKNAAKTDYKNPQWTARLSCKLQFIRHAFTQRFDKIAKEQTKELISTLTLELKYAKNMQMRMHQYRFASG